MVDRSAPSLTLGGSSVGQGGARRVTLGRRYRGLRRHRYLVGYALVAPPILYLLVLTIYPLLYTLQLSLLSEKQGSWVFVGPSNFVSIVSDPWFWNAFLGTLEFTIPSVVLHLAIGMALALLVNGAWFSTTLRNLVRGVFILPWIFSTSAAALIWSLLFHPFGVLNSLALGVLHVGQPIDFLGTPGLAMASLVLVNTWKSYPFYMLAILGALQAIPPELYEAAKVDGASTWQQFTHITIPQISPTLSAISTIDVISTFGHVDLMKIMTQGGPFRSTETLAFYVYKRGFGDGDLGQGAAMSTLVLLVLALFAVIYLRLVFRTGDSDETSV